MQRYTPIAMLLHWLIALLIVAAFTMGLVMTDIPGITPTKLKYFSWHKGMGDCERIMVSKQGNGT